MKKDDNDESTITRWSTWWLTPLTKQVITLVISGLTLLIPLITRVITRIRVMSQQGNIDHLLENHLFMCKKNMESTGDSRIENDDFTTQNWLRNCCNLRQPPRPQDLSAFCAAVLKPVQFSQPEWHPIDESFKAILRRCLAIENLVVQGGPGPLAKWLYKYVLYHLW